jgi:PhnB protein
MPKLSQSEQFDRIVTALLASRAAVPPNSGKQLAGVAAIAGELRALPRQDFKSALKAKLEGRTTTMASTAPAAAGPEQTARQSVTAHLIVKGGARALDFYQQAFGAVVTMRLNGPADRVAHAELRIGNATFMLADEFPEHGSVSPQTLGGSPVTLHISVDDADAAFARAVEAGARVSRPVEDQFYGERSGQVIDPFGFIWSLSAPKEIVSPEQMQKRFDKIVQGEPRPAGQTWVLPVPYIRKGFRTLTPYLLVPDAAKVIDFLKEAFGGEEIFRVPRGSESNVIMHAEVRVQGSMVELADATEEFKPRESMNILYVPDVDAAYQRAIRAGGTSMHAPIDQAYGDRDAVVKDPGGSTWCISSRGTGEHLTADTPSLVPIFSVRNAAGYVDFLKQAFGAKEAFVNKDDQGVVIHCRLRIGDSILAGGEAHGERHAGPFLLHMYVPDTDAVYAKAIDAGASTIRGLEDAPYGDRTATVQDPFGNLWSLATHVRDVKF